MQYLFPPEIYQARRNQLKASLESGIILFPGSNESPMNFPANPYPFRQDSTFLYYFGIDQPGMNAVIDLDSGAEVLFGDDLSVEDVVWMGPHESIASLGEKVGIRNVKPADALSATLAGKDVHYLPPYRDTTRIALAKLLGKPLDLVAGGASESLTKAVVAQRSKKRPEEIAQMEEALHISAEMHRAVMEKARPGWREAELVGIAQRIAKGRRGGLAYPAILTINGHTLHNHDHHHILQEGQLVLADMGAENKMRYAGDITRTFPVSKTFTTQQKDIYQIVLEAEERCILDVRPGIAYRDVHLNAARIITEGLKSLGLMQGDVEEAVAAGAHALFFPHGLGHMIGLDVHDMEDLGEQYIGYGEGYERSKQFGLAYLRMAKPLEPGFVLTVEPGIYFIPELIDAWKAEGRHDRFIRYNQVEKFRNFSGIRVEDNVLVTDSGNKILGPHIPKKIEEIEELRSN